MRKEIVCWLVVALGVECLGCSNTCLCYTWEGLSRTDCVGKNLFNTFLGFSHQTQVLDLSYNVISILHGNEFLDANLRNLQDLRLSNNRLHRIDKLTFNGLEFLKHLDMSCNSLEHLHPSTFKYNPNLKTLNVSFNPLGLVKGEPFLSPAGSLEVLDMTNCHLEFVTSRSFADLKRLLVLNISRNHFREIEFGFVEGMESLKYLDVSESGLPCGDQSRPLLRSLLKRKIRFQAFCHVRNNEELVLPVLEMKETTQMELGTSRGGYNVTQRDVREKSFLNDVIQFFQSIPSFYAIVCGVQLGIFIGSFATYFCIKKTIKVRGRDAEQGEAGRGCRSEESDNSTFALVPLNTPPGTPPSPYHSRFFPSSFSLSPT